MMCANFALQNCLHIQYNGYDLSGAGAAGVLVSLVIGIQDRSQIFFLEYRIHSPQPIEVSSTVGISHKGNACI
jgi:hypothetical protein